MVNDALLMTGGLGMIGALIGAMLIFFLAISLVLHIYYALAFMTIARKLGHSKPWLAWIPIANGALILQLGGFHWAWIFLMLIPVLGWIALGIMGIIAMWRIYEKRNYPGWLALIPLLSFLVFIPFVGWLIGLANLVIIGLVAWHDK